MFGICCCFVCCRRAFLPSAAFVLFWTRFLFDTLTSKLCMCDDESEHCVSFSTSASSISQHDEASKLLPRLVIHSQSYGLNFYFKYFVATTKIYNRTCAHSPAILCIRNHRFICRHCQNFCFVLFLVDHNPIIHFVPFFRNAATHRKRRTKMLMWANKIIMNRRQSKPTAIFAFVVSANVIDCVHCSVDDQKECAACTWVHDITDDIRRAHSHQEIRQHF